MADRYPPGKRGVLRFGPRNPALPGVGRPPGFAHDARHYRWRIRALSYVIAVGVIVAGFAVVILANRWRRVPIAEAAHGTPRSVPRWLKYLIAVAIVGAVLIIAYVALIAVWILTCDETCF